MNINPTITSQKIQVFSKEIRTLGGITFSARSESYLAYHGLHTHWFAEPTNGLDADTFETLLTSLPVLPEDALTTAFCIQIFVEGTHGETPRIHVDNARGYAVYSLETKAVMCRYFRHIARDPGYEHIEKADSLGGSILSSEEMTLLHFGKFSLTAGKRASIKMILARLPAVNENLRHLLVQEGPQTTGEE